MQLELNFYFLAFYNIYYHILIVVFCARGKSTVRTDNAWTSDWLKSVSSFPSVDWLDFTLQATFFTKRPHWNWTLTISWHVAAGHDSWHGWPHSRRFIIRRCVHFWSTDWHGPEWHANWHTWTPHGRSLPHGLPHDTSFKWQAI